jgi:hypothetical protein
MACVCVLRILHITLFLVVDMTDTDGKTPFFIACMRNHVELVDFFLKIKTVDINAVDVYRIYIRLLIDCVSL